LELGVLAPGRAVVEAVEGAEDGVLLILLGRPPGPGRQPRAGEPDEPHVIALPEELGGGGVPPLDVPDPRCDGTVVLGRHGLHLLGWQESWGELATSGPVL